MSVKIRLSRGGTKKRPYYYIVVATSASPRDGRYIEQVGTHNPLLPKDHADRVKLNVERVQHWLSVGAQPTDRVLRFLDKAGPSPSASRATTPARPSPARSALSARRRQRRQRPRSRRRKPWPPRGNASFSAALRLPTASAARC